MCGHRLLTSPCQKPFHEDQAVATAGFTSSAGIAANKLLAKVSSALNKPNQQTLVPPRWATL